MILRYKQISDKSNKIQAWLVLYQFQCTTIMIIHTLTPVSTTVASLAEFFKRQLNPEGISSFARITR